MYNCSKYEGLKPIMCLTDLFFFFLFTQKDNFPKVLTEHTTIESLPVNVFMCLNISKYYSL